MDGLAVAQRVGQCLDHVLRGDQAIAGFVEQLELLREFGELRSCQVVRRQCGRGPLEHRAVLEVHQATGDAGRQGPPLSAALGLRLACLRQPRVGQRLGRGHPLGGVELEHAAHEVPAHLGHLRVRHVPLEVRGLGARAVRAERQGQGEQGERHHAHAPDVRPGRPVLGLQLRGRVLGQDQVLAALLRRDADVLQASPVGHDEPGISSFRRKVHVVRSQVLVHDALGVGVRHGRTDLAHDPLHPALRERARLTLQHIQQVAARVQFHDDVHMGVVLEGLDLALDVGVV
mmetsp:Transcript_46233/g.140160  ORF Transcript_46233/g.140160 Transcript_46233/m.140160 type:complete len:288 (-) Transcript_46233:503-1366(-)